MPNERLMEVLGQKVLPEWIDYNGHMNVAYYVLAFDKALDKVCDNLGIGIDYVRRTNHSLFALEAHVTYLREVHDGDPLRCTWQLLDCDAKRFHYVMAMHHAEQGFLSALSEQIALHVDLTTRRAASFPAEIHRRLDDIRHQHRDVPRPAQVGHVIGIQRKAAE
jgi:acyl-CoA thioester hydrolase